MRLLIAMLKRPELDLLGLGAPLPTLSPLFPEAFSAIGTIKRKLPHRSPLRLPGPCRRAAPLSGTCDCLRRVQQVNELTAEVVSLTAEIET
jgi:hypothetical protein